MNEEAVSALKKVLTEEEMDGITNTWKDDIQILLLAKILKELQTLSKWTTQELKK